MSSNSTNLILVTGISGYLGAHIAHQLLELGYRVRGTVRSAKITTIQQQFAAYGDKVEIVGIDDLIHGDYTSALKGVHGVIHAAAPLVGKEESAAAQIDASVEGTRNILSYVEAAGVKTFVLISSIVAVTELLGRDPSPLVTDKDWASVTREIALDPSSSGFTVYTAEKKLAEQVAWAWADKHPNVEVATVNPTFFIGPFAPEWAPSKMDLGSISTNRLIYNLISPDGPGLPDFSTIDVRDVARASVLSLRAPPTSEVGRKRFILSSEWFSSADAVEYIEKIHPELKDRLSEIAKQSGPVPESNFDTSRVKEVLGFEFTDWHKTVSDAVDSLLALESGWISKGWVRPAASYGF